jgi:4-alpha-glucanotransferase
MLVPRSSGILLHPTSFPGRFGVGDLGSESHRFIDYLVGSGQQYWQVLPLGPTGYGNSPYASYSALAGNPLLISLERLQEQELLESSDLENLPDFSMDRVEFDRAYETKYPLLRKACAAFKDADQKEFEQFCQAKAFWLEDYALYMALKEDNQDASWHTWAPELRNRDADTLAQARQRLADSIYFHKFVQFTFFQQWVDLKKHANDRGIEIIGDIPIYVAHDSADVWANPENFELDPETGEAKLMAGVPPDYFSETGQLWGNPVYKWDYLQETGFKWWIQRFGAMLDLVDQIRIDHFRGFEAYWAVPQGEKTAIAGEWIEAPGQEFFEALDKALGKLPILAEDLGIITPEVEALRDRFGFPGMKILHFAFGSDPGNAYLPFNHSRNSVVYTGTHDNNTTVGWYETLSDYERNNLIAYLGCISPDGIHWDLIRLALSSISNLCILPAQDIFGLGAEARMNVPSKAEGNWDWRYRPDFLSDWSRDRLKHLTYLFGRAPQPRND